MLVSLVTGQLPFPAYSGFLLAGPPFVEEPALVVLPGSGELALDLTLPLLPPGEEAVSLWLQALLSPDGTTIYLSSWSPLVILDAAF